MRRTTPRVRRLLVALATIGMASVLTAASAVARPWLGVYTQEITQELRDGLDLHGDGVLVNRVVDGSPADRAGLRNGDVILRFNSRAVESPQALSELVGAASDGQEVALSIVRHGDVRTLAVTLGTRPADEDGAPMVRQDSRPGDDDEDDAPAAPHAKREMRVHVDVPDAPNAPEPPSAPGEKARRKVIVRVETPDGEKSTTKEYRFDGDPSDMADKALRNLPNLEGLRGLANMGTGLRLGVRLEPLTEDMASALGASGGTRGVLVLEAIKDTPAERAGLRAGDIVTGVDGKPVASAGELQAALRAAGRTASIDVVRHGAKRTFDVELAGRSRGASGEDSEDHGRSEGDARVFRLRTRDGADTSDLRQQVEQLRQQLRDLERQLEDRKHD